MTLKGVYRASSVLPVPEGPKKTKTSGFVLRPHLTHARTDSPGVDTGDDTHRMTQTGHRR